MNVLYSILAFAIVLGIIVVVHEFGHYIAARLTGVRVETFSFGFGKRLFGKKIGETDFRMSLIPLGGYVKMAGEEEYDPNDLKPYEFQAKNRAQKIFILVMGSIMNLVLAFFIFSITNMTGVEVEAYKSEPPRIGFVERNSPAEKAGIQKGDIIKTIEGRRIENWKELEITIGSNPNQELPVKFERNGELRETTLDIKSITRYHVGDAGLYWDFKTKIHKVAPDSPAFKAQLKAGDFITAIDGQPVCYYETFAIIGKSAEKSVKLRIQRGEEYFDVDIVPQKAHFLDSPPIDTIKEATLEYKKIKKQLELTLPKVVLLIHRVEGKYRIQSDYLDTLPDPALYKDYLVLADKGIIGAELTINSPTRTIRFGLFPAMGKSIKDMVNLIDLVFTSIRKLIVGKLSPKSLSSVIDIAEISQEAMKSGPTNFFLLIAFISLQLGIINLFPIPALDGGHLLIYSLEAVIRKELSLKMKNFLINFGFVILIALMVFLLLNDIAKRLPNGWNSLIPF